MVFEVPHIEEPEVTDEEIVSPSQDNPPTLEDDIDIEAPPEVEQESSS